MERFLKKTACMFAIFFSLQTVQAGMIGYGIRGAGQLAWVTTKAFWHYGRPMLKEAAQKIRPTVEKIAANQQVRESAQVVKAWVKENPKHAAVIGLGAAVGYKTSGDGVVKTTIGTTLGAAAGFSLYLNYLRLAAAQELAMATDMVAVWEGRALLLEEQAAVFKARWQMGAQALKDLVAQRDAAVQAAKKSAGALQELMTSNATKMVAPVVTPPQPTAFSTITTFKTLFTLRGATPVATGAKVNALELAALGA